MSFVLFVSLMYISFVIKRRQYLIIEDTQGKFYKIIILISGFISVLVGIDKGESIYGFLRLCVYLIVGIAVQQIREKDRRRILLSIPVLGIVLSICSLFHNSVIFQHWIALPTGRLAGPFEYPNTMALFLLLGVIIVEHLEKCGKYIVQLLLIVGVIATGSRTIFVVLCIFLLYRYVQCRGRNKTFITDRKSVV